MRRVQVKFDLKELLWENRMSQVELAEKSKIRAATISKWCNQEKLDITPRISPEQIAALMNAFNFESIDQLFEVTIIEE